MIRVKDQFWLGAPPRLLAGAALLFWGTMVGRPLLGLVLAVVVEAKQWIKVRWRFGEPGYVKAWYLTVFFVVCGAMTMWLSDEGGKGLLGFVSWLPLMLLPLELAQRYGEEGRLALNSLFLVARRRMIKDLEEGRDCSVFYIHTGYYYFGAILVAASMNRVPSWEHQVGCVVLLLWALLGVNLRRGLRWQAFVIPAVIVLGLSYLAKSSAAEFWQKLARNSGGSYEPNGDLLTQVTTRIGSLGSIKNSKKVRWRLWSDSDPPSLLRLNSYNAYNPGGQQSGGAWNNLVVDPLYRSVDDSFETGIAVGGSKDLYVFHRDHTRRVRNMEGLQELKLRSTQLSSKSSSTLVLAPMGCVVFGEAAGENSLPESNTSGAIRLLNREAILDYKLWVDEDQSLLDGPIREGFDDLVPDSELEALENVVQELGLRELPDREKVSRLRKWFFTEFRYTTHLLQSHGGAEANQSTPLEEFLTINKSGHCEYFATAATLLLRQAGVPSRYCVGYALSEQSVLNEDMWLMRGTHAHAWSSAYIDGRWEDVDVTPAGWNSEFGLEGWVTALKDWLQGLQEELRLWRIESVRSFNVTLLITIGGVVLALFIGLRLWLTRPTVREGMKKARVRTLLYLLERRWRKQLGGRREGETLSNWIRSGYEVFDVRARDLEQLIDIYEKKRFSGVDISPTDGAEMKRLIKVCQAAKTRSKQ